MRLWLPPWHLERSWAGEEFLHNGVREINLTGHIDDVEHQLCLCEWRRFSGLWFSRGSVFPLMLSRRGSRLTLISCLWNPGSWQDGIGIPIGTANPTRLAHCANSVRPRARPSRRVSFIACQIMPLRNCRNRVARASPRLDSQAHLLYCLQFTI